MAATARLTHVYPSITCVLKGPGPVLCSTDRYRHVCIPPIIPVPVELQFHVVFTLGIFVAVRIESK